MKKFKFGKVKGKAMIEVLNMEKIHGNFNGLQYLVGMKKITSNKWIKEEIEDCFKTYAKDYKIMFGMYKELSLEKIDYENSSYVENYLGNNDSEEIKEIVSYYIKYCRNKNRKSYNSYQEQAYSQFNQLRKMINERNRQEDIKSVLHSIGYDMKKKALKSCPWHCEKKNSKYEHSYLLYGDDGSWLIYCCKCNTGQNFIKFVGQKLNLSENEAISYIANHMGISTGINTINPDTTNIKKEIQERNNSVELIQKELSEIDLKDFGFKEGVYPPYFYKRGFTIDNAKQLDIHFAGKYCNNQFKNRICFLVKDLKNRVVGAVGRTIYSEEEFYKWHINKNNIDSSLSYHKKVSILREKGIKYKKYYNKIESRFTLYNANNLEQDAKEVFICEGPFDVVAMVCKHGYNNTVGMFGKNLKNGQLFQLYSLYKDKRDSLEIHLFVDNDGPGLKAFEDNVRKLQELGFTKINKMILSRGKDAAEATKYEVDEAYCSAEIQSVRYNKKKIVLLDIDEDQRLLLEH